MPIELNKILADIAAESMLKPTTNAKKDEIELAWVRVSKKSNLSVHETKSIFKVLQKKYEQEKQKDHSSWKLFDVMNEIHTPDEEDEDESDISMEENEEYEMLEVDEEQQQESQQTDSKTDENIKTEALKSTTLKKPSTEMTSDGESPTKSKSDTSRENTPERATKEQTEAKKNEATSQREEKKLLNLLLSPNSPRLAKHINAASSAAAIALQKKGITLKKANAAPQPSQAQQQVTGRTLLRNSQTSDARIIQLPESIKRKLNEDISTATATKKILLGQPTGNVKQISPKSVTTKALVQSKIAVNGSLLMKMESEEKNSTNVREENTSISSNNDNATSNTLKVITLPVEPKVEENSALKVITLPVESSGSLIANGISTVKKSNANGVSTSQIQELDFSDHVLISTNVVNNSNEDIPHVGLNTKESTLNLGNFSNELPRAFFNNLCNSKRYEAFALYIANAMNRLETSVATRLEVTIMRALLDAQSEALEKS